MAKAVTQFIPARCAVITVSDTRTEANDTSGDFIAEALVNAGHQVVDRKLIKDEIMQLRHLVERLTQQAIDVVIITGGTGISARDITPEAVRPLFTKDIPGFGELFRMLSYQDIGTSTIQSRALAGLCNKTLVFCLPGSTGACRLAMEKIILEQINSTHRPCNFMTLLNPA
ncbi:MAG: molybdenum cofactor biosynthesis protein B [Acidobacteria bacterium]|nr:molybdenum cofactor biosynthesis protein B [Acidobacteriota bacterium]MCB9396378.1 molybdenum cofactor biosynthesis protein B [Acidobacteriota bacterium]